MTAWGKEARDMGQKVIGPKAAKVAKEKGASIAAAWSIKRATAQSPKSAILAEMKGT